MLRELKEVFWEAKYDDEMEKVFRKLSWRITCIKVSFMIAGVTMALATGFIKIVKSLLVYWEIELLMMFVFLIVFYVVARFFIYFLSNTVETDFRKTLEFFVKKFGKYGKVLSIKDWKQIKNNTGKVQYINLFRKSNYNCYYYDAWTIASLLDEAQIMLCSIVINKKRIAKAVVVKNSCVYDITLKMHIDYNRYIEDEDLNVQIYKVYKIDELAYETYLTKTKEEFRSWCKKNDVLCKF